MIFSVAQARKWITVGRIKWNQAQELLLLCMESISSNFGVDSSLKKWLNSHLVQIISIAKLKSLEPYSFLLTENLTL